MLTDIFLNCPFCIQQQMKVEDFITHLKKEHNYAITQLINFQDPRYFIQLLIYEQTKNHNFLIENSYVRKSDSVNTIAKNEIIEQLRKIAFAFMRKRCLEQRNYERDQICDFECFICNEEFKNLTLMQQLTHYTEEHGLRLGNKQNLVYIKMLLKVIKDTFNQLKCLYCGTTFDSKSKLKNHYRTHNHFKLPQKELKYDGFFINNYRQLGCYWTHDESDSELSSDISKNEIEDLEQEDDEYKSIPKEYLDVLNEVPYIEIIDYNNQLVQCLFCSKQLDISKMNHHLQDVHNFDINKQTQGDFYQRVKQINFIRQNVYTKICPFCKQLNYEETHINQHSNDQISYKQDQGLLLPFNNNDLIYYLLDQSISEDLENIQNEQQEENQ